MLHQKYLKINIYWLIVVSYTEE
ncbi:hypothetical protein FWK35_00031161 [Aphis craccivora]|uniref:Uncharacterized protein n=1 Tax=Aphis craccivora TaxID=307492 RepID=A0A6G0VV96_APHCR|nr:hypothetical protein FWK35_00031161 [Aphis craccivora]